MLRRLWSRFEVLPFRYGMTLVAALIVVPALLIAGIVFGSGSGGRPSHNPVGRSSLEAAVPSPSDWGQYVPPRQQSNSTEVAPAPRTVPPPVSHPSSSASPSRPMPTFTCPPNYRKWRWAWAMCRGRPPG
jgi:hypothetical protein